jgi:hypothetical protein
MPIVRNLPRDLVRNSTLVILKLIVVPSLVMVWLLGTVAGAQPQDMPEGHEGMSMSMPMDHALSPSDLAKIHADKLESEFNHHLAGCFLLLAGVFFLAEGDQKQHWAFTRFAWPACFLLSGIFVIIFSDTELWPFGRQQWLHTMAVNGEVLQHKLFALILLGLGVIEMFRARGTLQATWWAWVFPIFAAAGAFMLLFHSHGAGMVGPNHMDRMATIQSEHLSYSITGFGIALTKGLSETHTKLQPFFVKLCPALMMVLGALLMVYVE